MGIERKPAIGELNQILKPKGELTPLDQPGLREWLKRFKKYEIVDWIEGQFATPLTDIHSPHLIAVNNRAPSSDVKPHQYKGTFSLYASSGDILRNNQPVRKLVSTPPEESQKTNSRILHAGRLKSGALVEIAANYSPRSVHQEIEHLSVTTDKDQPLTFRILIKDGQPVLEIQEADQFRLPTKEENGLLHLGIKKDCVQVFSKSLALRLTIPMKFLPPLQR